MATTVKNLLRVPLDGTTMTADFNIELVYTPQWHVRMWLGKRLLRMAAWVLGCNFYFPSTGEAPKASE